MTTHIQFLGAADSVAGSRYLIARGGHRAPLGKRWSDRPRRRVTTTISARRMVRQYLLHAYSLGDER